MKKYNQGFAPLLLFLLVALPVMVWAVMTLNVNPFKRAASGEPTVTLSPTASSIATATPTNSCTICLDTPGGRIDTCSLSACSIPGTSATCGGVTYCCGLDGYWGSSYGVCSTPSATRTPTPTAYPTQSPLATIIASTEPTATPKPTPTPRPSVPPTISTSIITPIAVKGFPYLTRVYAFDRNNTDKVKLVITGLPEGLKVACIKAAIVNKPNRVYCTVTGKASTSGNFTVTATATDTTGLVTTKTYNLNVISFY